MVSLLVTFSTFLLLTEGFDKSYCSRMYINAILNINI